MVSIHAPVRERRKLVHDPVTDDGFNPRSREGATAAIGATTSWSRRFNPRSREGATSLQRTSRSR